MSFSGLQCQPGQLCHAKPDLIWPSWRRFFSQTSPSRVRLSLVASKVRIQASLTSSRTSLDLIFDIGQVSQVKTGSNVSEITYLVRALPDDMLSQTHRPANNTRSAHFTPTQNPSYLLKPRRRGCLGHLKRASTPLCRSQKGLAPLHFLQSHDPMCVLDLRGKSLSWPENHSLNVTKPGLDGFKRATRPQNQVYQCHQPSKLGHNPEFQCH